jgi:hypothetical protein
LINYSGKTKCANDLNWHQMVHLSGKNTFIPSCQKISVESLKIRVEVIHVFDLLLLPSVTLSKAIFAFMCCRFHLHKHMMKICYDEDAKTSWQKLDKFKPVYIAVSLPLFLHLHRHKFVISSSYFAVSYFWIFVFIRLCFRLPVHVSIMIEILISVRSFSLF